MQAMQQWLDRSQLPTRDPCGSLPTTLGLLRATVLALIAAAAAAGPVRAVPPPNDDCAAATVIPGAALNFDDPCYDVSMATATCEFLSFCGQALPPQLGSVWYLYTPVANGAIHVDTSGSNYDTVLSIHESIPGQSPCPFMDGMGVCQNFWVPIACNDDFGGTPQSQVDCVPVQAGWHYAIRIGNYNPPAGGDTLCFHFSACPRPVAALTVPAALGCACNATPISGEADDPTGACSITQWTLEYQPAMVNVWTEIATSGVPVPAGGGLAVWATPAAQGWYFLRLTVTNRCGQIDTAVNVVWVDKQFDNALVRAPVTGDVLRRTVCIDGTMWDQCFSSYTVKYKQGAGALMPVDPANPTYNSTVITDPIASWDTAALGLADGNYDLVAVGTDSCGHSSPPIVRNVIVDNTAPTAFISSPLPCTYVNGMVVIRGTADDANLASWVLQYSDPVTHTWHNPPINSGIASVINNVLGTWDTTGLPPCAYTIRLVVVDKAAQPCDGITHNVSEYTVSVDVGSCCDLNRDGAANGLDVATFTNCLLGMGCP